MSAISNRLERGLKAAEAGDVDTARQILGEVADTDDGWAPVSGLSSQAEANYYSLLGRVLEHEEQEEVAEEAFSKAHDLEEEAQEMALRLEGHKDFAAALVPCACGSLADVREEDHDWSSTTAFWDDGKNRVGADLLFMIWKALQDNQIEIPFPQREVRIVHSDKKTSPG